MFAQAHRRMTSVLGSPTSKDARQELDVTTAIELENEIIKSGYLIKRAVESGANWKSRYFVLNGNTITYYKDHKHTTVAKGDLLLMPNTEIADFEEAERAFGFTVNSHFKELRLVAASEGERQEWKKAIAQSVLSLSETMRGYLLKKGGMFESWNRKFFVLHSDSITYHPDHSRTSKIQGALKLTHNTVLELGQNLTLRLMDMITMEKSLTMKAETEPIRRKWEKAVSQAIIKLQQTDDKNAKITGGTGSERIIRQGFLAAKSAKVEDVWQESFFVLTPYRLYQYEDQLALEPQDVYRLTPSSSVFETNLKPHAFQLVTAYKVLHTYAMTASETNEWLRALREAILNSTVDEEDPLMVAAGKIPEEFYDVTFTEKKPLGVVLERSGEWALVRVSNVEETRVYKGSALSAINGNSTMLSTYADTIGALSGWKPPLTLRFRKPPEKRGWLTKQARARRGVLKNWRPRYFVLSGGRLMYYSSDDESAPVRGDIQLMGSAVSLVAHTEIGQHFCFRVVSGVSNLAMQGLTVDDMMDWASTLFYAIAIANGGGYLLDRERKNQQMAKDEESRLVRLAEVKEKVSQRIDIIHMIDTRIAEAEAILEKAKGERLRAESACAHIRQEQKRAPSEELDAILTAAEEEARIKRQREEIAFQRKCEIIREAERERVEAERLTEELEDQEVMAAQQEYMQELEMKAIEQHVKEQQRLQLELEEERSVRVKEVMALEEDKERRRPVISEFRESVLSVLEDSTGFKVSVVPRPASLDSKPAYTRAGMHTVVLRRPGSMSDVLREEAMISASSVESTANIASEAASQKDSPDSNAYNALMNGRNLATPRQLHAMLKVMPVAAISPRHARNNSMSSASDDLDQQSPRTSFASSVTMEEPVEVKTVEATLQPQTLVVTEAPPPLPAIRVRTVARRASIGTDRIQVVTQLQLFDKSSPKIPTPLSPVQRPVIFIPPRRTQSSRLERTELPRTIPAPNTSHTSESDRFDFTARPSLDSLSSFGVERANVESEYEGGDELDVHENAVNPPSGTSSVPSPLESMRSSEYAHDDAYELDAYGKLIVRNLTDFDISRLSLDVQITSRSLLESVVRRRSFSQKSLPSPGSPGSRSLLDSGTQIEGLPDGATRSNPSECADVESNDEQSSEIASDAAKFEVRKSNRSGAARAARSTRTNASAKLRKSGSDTESTDPDDADTTTMPSQEIKPRKSRTQPGRHSRSHMSIGNLFRVSPKHSDDDLDDAPMSEYSASLTEPARLSQMMSVSGESCPSMDESELSLPMSSDDMISRSRVPPVALVPQLQVPNRPPESIATTERVTQHRLSASPRHMSSQFLRMFAHDRGNQIHPSNGSTRNPATGKELCLVKPTIDQEITHEMLQAMHHILSTEFDLASQRSTSHKPGPPSPTTGIQPVTFSQIIRAVTGAENLFKEMQLFHKFDTSNSGRLSYEDFLRGLSALQHGVVEESELAARMKAFIRSAALAWDESG